MKVKILNDKPSMFVHEGSLVRLERAVLSILLVIIVSSADVSLCWQTILSKWRFPFEIHNVIHIVSICLQTLGSECLQTPLLLWMRSLHCKHRANELQVSFVWNNFRDLRMIWTIRSSSANYRVLSWKPSAIGLKWTPPSFASTIDLHLEIVKAQFKITRLINSICQRVSWSAIDRSSWINQIAWFERFSKFCRRNSSWPLVSLLRPQKAFMNSNEFRSSELMNYLSASNIPPSVIIW